MDHVLHEQLYPWWAVAAAWLRHGTQTNTRSWRQRRYRPSPPEWGAGARPRISGGTITWPACASSLMSWHVLRSTVACILRACPYNHRCQMPRNDSNYSSPISRQTFLRCCLRLSFKACSAIEDMAAMGRSYQVIRGQRMLDTHGQDEIDDIESKSPGR